MQNINNMTSENCTIQNKTKTKAVHDPFKSWPIKHLSDLKSFKHKAAQKKENLIRLTYGSQPGLSVCKGSVGTYMHWDQIWMQKCYFLRMLLIIGHSCFLKCKCRALRTVCVLLSTRKKIISPLIYFSDRYASDITYAGDRQIYWPVWSFNYTLFASPTNL